MKPTRAEELYFDPVFDLFMLTERELADRALHLATACCQRAQQATAGREDAAVRTAFRAVILASRLADRAHAADAAADREADICPCPWRIP